MDAAQIQPLLERIGLNHHEASVYLLLLSRGQQSASQLARDSRTPRSTIRSILDKLCTMGILDKVYRGNVQYYSCLSADALTRFVQRDVEEKKQQVAALKEVEPLINALRNTESHMPVVRYFEGEKGVIEAFNHSLVTQPDEILFLTSYDFFQTERIRKYDVQEYLPERIRRGISMCVLGPPTKEGMHWHKRSKEELRKHRFLPEESVLPGNFFIYDKYVLYFSANQGEYIASLTESIVMADTMRTLFENLWRTAKVTK